jgi:flagella synthesis protein FlgN
MSQPLQGELDRALQAVLADMQRAVGAFAQALDEERAALDANDSSALDQAGAHKQAIVLQLEQLDAERQQLNRETPASATTLAPLWTQIVQSLQRCQQLNRRNGSAVNQRLNQVRQALLVLTGHPGESGVYGPTGGLHASLRSQVLAEV